MQQESNSGNTQSVQIIDQTTQSIISLNQTHILVKSITTGQVKKYPLPPLKVFNDKQSYPIPLRFTSKNPNVMINPNGNILSCKTPSLQQVDFQKSFSYGIICWAIYVPQKTHTLSVGVKDIKNKKSLNFDFSLKHSVYLTFKLDLYNKCFKCWVNELQSDWHKPIILDENCNWTPFIRIKHTGNSVILNSFVEDPQFQISPFNPFRYCFNQAQIQQVYQKSLFIQNKQRLRLQKINNNKLILVGQNIFKIVHRGEKDYNFNFDFVQFEESNILIPFKAQQIKLINDFSKRTNIVVLQNISQSQSAQNVSKSRNQWKNWIKNTLRSIDKILKEKCNILKGQSKQNISNISIEEINFVAKITLSKFQMLRPCLGKIQVSGLIYSQMNQISHSGQRLNIFQSPKIAFKIQKQYYLNNLSFINMNNKIHNIKSTQNSYIAVHSGNNNKISIINAQYVAFKIIDTFISRGFNKENEINQYQKQIQNIQDSDFTKPHIFKILKNCLKYADKIKPPEKLLKQLQKKKQQEEKLKKAKTQKIKQPSLVADKSLLNTLIMMGFNQKLSTKVLIQCKNSSLEAALDLVLNKYKNQNSPIKPPGNNIKPKSDWQCQVCTLINSKQVSLCSACQSPAPIQTTKPFEQQLKKKQQVMKKQEIKQKIQEQISSPILQNQNLLNFFIWNTNVVYCPILIAAVFKDKIRFRLLGPNPKYYSYFYLKENGYIDLTTLRLYQFAHQIDQSQINNLNYLSSSTQQLRKNNWGWMNIQDFDYKIPSYYKVQNIIFMKGVSLNEQQKFNIQIVTLQSSVNLSSKIIFDNVYQKKRRCLIIQETEKNQRIQQFPNLSHILTRKKQYIIENQLRMLPNVKLNLDFFAQNDSTIQITQIYKNIHEKTEKPIGKLILPLIAFEGAYNSDLKYPHCKIHSLTKNQFNPLKIYKNGIVFKNLNDQKIQINNLLIEKKDKKNHQNTGFVYLINDLNKKPLNKYEFSFDQQGGKTNVNLNNEQGKYLVVVLNPIQNNSESIQINYIGAIGSVIEKKSKYQLNTQLFKIEFQNQSLNNKEIKDLFKISWNFNKNLIQLKADLLNYLLQIKAPIVYSFSLSWKNKQMKNQKIRQIKFEGYRLIKSQIHYKQTQQEIISEREYRASLQTFIQTLDPQSFEIIQKDQNQEYKHLINEYNLDQFIVQKILECPYDKRLKNRLTAFINNFSSFLQNHSSFKTQQILKKAINLQSLSAYGLELSFIILKKINLSPSQFIKSLWQQIKIIIKRKQTQRLITSAYISQNSSNKLSLFSDLFFNLSSGQKDSLNNFENLINYQYLCENNKIRKKYIIDMMSLYKVQNLALKFQYSNVKSKLNILISFINSQGQQEKLFNKFLQENVWAQICGDYNKEKGSNKFSSNIINFHMNHIKTRYIIIDLNFSIVPFINSKEQDSIPINQIIPIVQGSYIGQSQYYYKNKFKNVLQNLHFVNKVQKFSKYSSKTNQNIFYYALQDAQHSNNKNLSIEQIIKMNPTPSLTESLVKMLMQKPTKNNLNFNYTASLLILDYILLIESKQSYQQLDVPIQFLQQMLNTFVNNQNSFISQKVIIFLKRIVKNDQKMFIQILKLKITSQFTFIQIYKDLNLKNQQNLIIKVQELIKNNKKLTKQSNQIINIAWFCKLHKLQGPIIQTVVQSALNVGKQQQIIFIFQKFGWTNLTVLILNKFILDNKLDKVQQILHSSKNNYQLCNFGYEQIKINNYDIFELILNQLSDINRKTKIDDLQNSIIFILDNIKGDQQYLLEDNQLFQRALSIINKFGYNEKIVNKLIKVYFALRQKQIYINQLLSSIMLQNVQNQELIFKQCIKRLNLNNSIIKNQDQLSILSQILIFILKKQTDIQNQNISINLQIQTQKEIIVFFSNFLYQHLNIGGIQSVKLLDKNLGHKISIAFFLTPFLKQKQVFSTISKQCIQKIINWLFININNNNQKDTRTIRTINCLRFIKIEEIVWKLLQAKTIFDFKTVSQVYKNIYKQKFNQFSGIRNIFLRNKFIKKANCFTLNILNRFSNSQQLLQDILNQSGIFLSILNQISNLKTKQSTQILNILNEQEQLVNNFNIYPDNKDKPKDWLIYKNGAKNHVYKIQFMKSSQQVVDLLLKNDKQFTLSKIVFGFKFDISGTQKNTCLPKQIIVQGGVSLDKMKLLGKMFEIPDDRYINYSVKLFGFNTNLIKNTHNIQTHCNKNLPINYLRFKIKSSDSISIQDALKIQTVQNKNLMCLVNFLSIQGYKQTSQLEQSYQLVKNLQSLTKVQHKKLINNLFNQQHIVQEFKKSLLNISFLMKSQNYQKILHNFLMRICEQNTFIGNEMIQKYLQLQNTQLCSKISSEIIISNDKQLNSRLTLYFKFIKQSLKNNKQNILKLLPFLKRFTQIIFYTQNRQKYQTKNQINKINLELSNQIIYDLISDADHPQIKDCEQALLTIQKFIKNLLTLQKPIQIKQLDLKQILNKLNIRKNKFQTDLLASLIIDSKQCRSWFMQNYYFQKLFQQTFSYIKQCEIVKLNKNLKFIILLSYNLNLKQLINKYQYNLKLFQLMMCKKFQNQLSIPQNEQLRKNFVEFISRTSLGSQNQNIIGALLKDSIPSIISQGNQKSVGQIFLPLLNSYQKIPICLIPYSKSENKLITDINNLDIKKKTSNNKKTQQGKFNQQKIRLPTVLISQNDKAKIIDQIKKASINSFKFNLIINHGNNTIGLSNIVQDKVIKASNSFLTIITCKENISLKNLNIIIFYNHKTKDLAKINKNCLQFTQGSFIYITDNVSSHLINKNNNNLNKNLFEFQKINGYDSSDSDDDTSLIIKNQGQIFSNINYSYNTFYKMNIQNLTKNSNNSLKDYKQATFSNIQFWNLQNTQNEMKKSSQISKLIQVNEKNSKNSLQNAILSNIYPNNLFNDKYLSQNSINSLRYQKVYEFPSSITVSELKQNLRIMNCSLNQKSFQNLNITTLGSTQNLPETITLEDIKKIKNLKQNVILDFNIDFDNIIQILNLKQEKLKEQVQFLPRKGILKYFEQNDGIHSMIKVIKKSIESWNNKQRMQKWLQYVTQLQKFSNFPHFFAMYLKDKQTFKLLFHLLAGLPDKQSDPKWDQLQSSSSLKLLKIISDILLMDKTSQFRQYAIKNQFFITILQRLRILTGIFKRKYQQNIEEDQVLSPSKNPVDDDGTKKIQKKKGVGYGNDSSSNTKWMKGQNNDAKKKQFEVVGIILNIIQNFLDIKHWKIPDTLICDIYESALLPFIQDGLRAGTLLQISKHPQKFKIIFKIIRVFSKHQKLIPILIPLSKNYQPRQIQSIQSLLKSLQNIASIFLACLNQNKNTQTKQQQVSEQLAKDIKETYSLIQQAIQEYKQLNQNNANQQKQMQSILDLPLDKKYRILMKDLRFDYIDMKQSPSKIKHHYSSNFNPNYTPNQVKMIRLAQQLADISTALPYQHTNAIYVRCDKDRVDFMQALIMGSNGTPYGHGAFLFDIYFDDNYPNGPPKVNLTTTGHGKIRFNPNLYACGKVCLSLLGTWRGSASQNWDAKVSTLLQVLLSIQAIIMSEEVYFNEPGFEHQQGTQQGQKKNQAYSNVVRYGNIKFAMIENLRNPPKGFQSIIRRHFYLKQYQIMQECKKWLKYAQKRAANYVGLVNDHNHAWCTEFKKSKTQYKQMLQKAVQQLEQQFKKLPVPKISDISSTKNNKKNNKKKNLAGNKLQQLQKAQKQQQEIDVSYDNNKISQSKQIDINDQKVKDRWSRYIGAMGIDAVSRQSKADILIYGLGPLGLEIVKNIVLSGCRKLTIVDQELVKIQDLSGGFFYTMQDIGKKRIQCILYKIKQLNAYVKIDTLQSKKIIPQIIKTYTIVISTEIKLSQQLQISSICRANNVKFISADCIGFTCRIVNDLGQNFQVLDKNGQQPVQVFIKQITSQEKGIVTLLDGVKHPFEDGQAILIKNVQGMNLKQDFKKSINETIHKVKIINSKSFEIGNTLNYTSYIRNGIAKNIKTPIQLKYKQFSQVVLDVKNVHSDQNLSFYDFSKLQNSILIKNCYLALEQFKKKHNKCPKEWNQQSTKQFIQIFKIINSGNLQQKAEQFVKKFALTCNGNLPPLCAFFGGLVCQQVIKAITQKFKPISSEFYIQFSQIVPNTQLKQQNLNKIFSGKQKRYFGFNIVIGDQLIEIIKNSKLFMVGSGAIGCQLLKNFAMIGFGTGKNGKITLTDPDHIQNSNLNRQFLFRQKHISKSKSRTASEVVKLMNPQLKNHISALTQRVSDSTKDIFTNKFFQSLTLVANALDNVAARRYVDQRCVQNKIPLFQSGTLGPKGHVQVIIPYLTQSYGSQNDPVQQGQIPHCTLKMFPQQTLHCVQWARDIFGKKFSLQPKALLKVLDKNYKPQKDDIKSLTQSLTMVKKGPKTFQDCINYAVIKFYKYFRDDVMQLLYTYPLEAKTKNGQPFWKLPKRPPTPLKQFNPQDQMHCTFISSLAVMIAKIYLIQYPKNFRTKEQRFYIGKMASKIKISQFIPSDQKAKEILKQSKQKKQEQAQQQKIQQFIQQKNQKQLYKEIMSTGINEFKMKAQQFQKDDDSNGHIDFIYSMANLRAINYKLDQMDWITVKLKAGRIVPALATTTACVSGLQTLQICKYLKKVKIDQMKNSYINLAVPSIQMSQPGEVSKKKISPKLTVNLWDRWQIQCEKNMTFGQLYESLQKKYQINPIGILQGMSRIDTGKTQEDKIIFLKEKILDKLDLEDSYIDIIVLFSKSKHEEKILQGVPPVRLLFK